MIDEGLFYIIDLADSMSIVLLFKKFNLMKYIFKCSISCCMSFESPESAADTVGGVTKNIYDSVLV